MVSDSGIIGELARDHHRIQGLLDRTRSAPPGSEERTSLVEEAGKRLVRHLVVEKEYLHPLLRRHVLDGEEWEGNLLAVDRSIEETLKSLEQVPPSGERHTELLLTLMADVTRHVVEQEQRVFPRLQALSPAAELRDAGSEAREAEAVAPTRPRPEAPDSPALTRLTSSVWGPWDRLRDRLSRRGLL
ncbi:hemerythrin domain-containing protein [Streptomyces sp. NPDC014776]|uniref:hemerythrin domain-containing protein n=1 Tax=unclassified Streptomyces TaxID=2593676 RepID=UPI0036FBF35B